MNITPLSAIADMADGLPVICVSGTVKYAGEVEHGTSPKGFDWAKQFFVLSNNGAEVGATLWQADGNEMKKGETVLIENTQDKKGQWSGMVKGSYTNKKKELCHTLEIRANQVKIKNLESGGSPRGIKPKAGESDGDNIPPGERQTSEANISAARRDDPPPQGFGPRGDLTQVDQRDIPPAGINEARQRIMQDANLMLIAMEGARYVAQQWKERHDCELPNEHFQALCHCFFIEASSRRTTDGVNWWSFTDKMPTKPVHNSNEKVECKPLKQEENLMPYEETF